MGHDRAFLRQVVLELSVAHSELILSGNDHAGVVQADLREPGSIPTSRRMQAAW